MRFPFCRNRDSVKNGILISIRRTGDGFHPGLFICLLFTACECLSVLKNMVLCGLPVPKKIEGWLRDFLVNMTSELPAEGSSEDKADKADRSSLPDKDVLEKEGVHHVG